MEYKNQFADVPPSERCRTTIELPRKTESTIKKYESKTGVLQTTVSILVTKLTDELTKSNLSDGERDRYQHAVASATLTFPDEYYNKPNDGKRVAVAKPAARSKRNSTKQAPCGNDGQRTAGLARETA